MWSLGRTLLASSVKFDFHFPTNVFPVLASIPELQWLRAFPAIGLCNPNSEDSGVHEGEDQVARRDFTH